MPGFSSILTPNSAPHTAFVQVGLNDDRAQDSFAYMNQVRATVAPRIAASQRVFSNRRPGGCDLEPGHARAAGYSGQRHGHAERPRNRDEDCASRSAPLPGVSDVLVPQDVDYPALKYRHRPRTRQRTGPVRAKEVVDSLITALTSDGMIAPSYWIDPKTGNNYLLTVQYPENLVNQHRRPRVDAFAVAPSETTDAAGFGGSFLAHPRAHRSGPLPDPPDGGRLCGAVRRRPEPGLRRGAKNHFADSHARKT